MALYSLSSAKYVTFWVFLVPKGVYRSWGGAGLLLKWLQGFMGRPPHTGAAAPLQPAEEPDIQPSRRGSY